jgi:hypothetical protein
MGCGVSGRRRRDLRSTGDCGFQGRYTLWACAGAWPRRRGRSRGIKRWNVWMQRRGATCPSGRLSSRWTARRRTSMGSTPSDVKASRPTTRPAARRFWCSRTTAKGWRCEPMHCATPRANRLKRPSATRFAVIQPKCAPRGVSTNGWRRSRRSGTRCHANAPPKISCASCAAMVSRRRARCLAANASV